jgi:hypothetical protein
MEKLIAHQYKFPEAWVIYWETTRKTPDQETLVLEFPDGSIHKYKEALLSDRGSRCAQ